MSGPGGTTGGSSPRGCLVRGVPGLGDLLLGGSPPRVSPPRRVPGPKEVSSWGGGGVGIPACTEADPP